MSMRAGPLGRQDAAAQAQPGQAVAFEEGVHESHVVRDVARGLHGLCGTVGMATKSPCRGLAILTAGGGDSIY